MQEAPDTVTATRGIDEASSHAFVEERESARAIELGRPSYSWGFGQDRRLEMVRRFVPLDGARILDVGCGIGT